MTASRPARMTDAVEESILLELGGAFTLDRLLEATPGSRVYGARRRTDSTPLRLHVLARERLRELEVEEDLGHALSLWGHVAHPGIVPLLGTGSSEHWIWCATPMAIGTGLDSRLQALGALPVDIVLRLAEQVGRALDEAHRMGLLHGALRPDQIFLDREGDARVTGFGVTLCGERFDGAPRREWSRAEDQAVFARTLASCLAGRSRPAMESGAPAGVPPAVWEVLRRAQSAPIAERFGDMEEFVRALRTARRPPTPVEPRDGAHPVLLVDRPPRQWRVPRGAIAVVGVLALVILASSPLTRAPLPPIAYPFGGTVDQGAGGPGPAAASPATPSRPGPSYIEGAPSTHSEAVRSEPVPSAPQSAPQSAPRSAPRSASRPASRPATVSTPPPEATSAQAPPSVAVESPPTADARLSVSARPWGRVYLDGRPLDATPLVDVPVSPGAHRLRIERPGYRPYETTIRAVAGSRVRIIDVVLVREEP
jgi:hypothetical protein